MSDERIYIYDCTLRDGAQTQGVDFNATDKGLIAKQLDLLGVDYIEGGWPGANPTDDAFFASAPTLTRSRLTAFGMTRRAGRSSDNDPGLNALLDCGTEAICMVGKTWDFHVDMALNIEHKENIAMIADSVAHATTKVNEVIFDAEHFFDGYKANPEFALACLEAAHDAGGRWIVLCDTNGGTLPHEITEIINVVTKQIPGSKLGIHCHNDTGNAVANSLAAVRAGVRQVQGALNGLGERCGNANLITIIPTLVLKMGYKTGLSAEDMTRLSQVSRILDECLGRLPERSAPYVGESAFTHKGGLHVSAVEKDPRTYEHVEPSLVGNQRHVVVSDQAGRSNILARFHEIGINVDPKDPKVTLLVEQVKEREFDGYSYDGAGASFELLARRALGKVPEFFRCNNFRVLDERRWNAKGELIIMSEATVKLIVDGEEYMTVAEGNGPVNALDVALRKVLTPIYPTLEDLRLVDFKVRILRSKDASAAMPRVMIESASDDGEHWSTVGVSTNIIEASYEALRDSIVYKLYRDGVA
jgi:2-isopropylmalate synthase